MLALEDIVGIGFHHVCACMGRQLQPRSDLWIRRACVVLDIAGACGTRNPDQARLPFLRNMPNRHEIIG